MAEDVLITCLPDEVTELILENSQLTIRDVSRFGLTCRHLQRTVFASNKLWRAKFFQRYVHNKNKPSSCLSLSPLRQ